MINNYSTTIHKAIFLMALLFCLQGSAQTNALGSWNIINVKLNINKKWSAFAEAQLRSLEFYNSFHYYEYKAGATYIFDKNFSLTAGLGKYKTYAEGGNFKRPISNDEIRTWLQINMKQQINRFQFEHRYRAEQRFTSNNYKNRFRYRLSLIVPIKKEKIEPKTFYVTIFNELFFTNNAPYFERNRFYVGLGYEFTNTFSMQTGYVSQFDYKLTDETGRKFFLISMYFNLDWKKMKAGFIPENID